MVTSKIKSAQFIYMAVNFAVSEESLCQSLALNRLISPFSDETIILRRSSASG